MAFLGERTEEYLLNKLHLNHEDIKSIKNGKVDWRIDRGLSVKGKKMSVLVLLQKPWIGNGYKEICGLSDRLADELIRLSIFEKRVKDYPLEDRPSMFADGEYDDWMGIDPSLNWEGFAKEYRKAADILSESHSSVPAPFLYLCRHTLELQLKTILMLSPNEVKLNHNLKGLWAEVRTIALSTNKASEPDLTVLDEIISEYIKIDSGNDAFRYPSDRDNNPHEREKYLHSFSHSQFAEKFQQASDCLDKIIKDFHSIKAKKLLTALFDNADEVIQGVD